MQRADPDTHFENGTSLETTTHRRLIRLQPEPTGLRVAETHLSAYALQHPSASQPRACAVKKNVPQKANPPKTKQKFSVQLGNGTQQKRVLAWHGVEVT